MKYILALFTFVIVCLFFLQEGKVNSERLIILNMIMSIICIWNIFSPSERPYSLNKVFHLFYFFFFCIAPVWQFKNKVYMLGTVFDEYDYWNTSLCLFFVLVLYNVLHAIFENKISVKRFSPKDRQKPLNVKHEVLFVILSTMVFFLYLYINHFSLSSLFFRGGDNVDRVQLSSTIWLFSEYFFRPMSVILFLVAYVVGVKHRCVLVVLFVLMLLSAPPTGMARFAVAALYIPVLLSTFPFFRRKHVFALMIIFGLMCVFPMLNTFRNFSSESSITFVVKFDQFENTNFDAYSMFMRVLGNSIVVGFGQLLGVLFFFVPRTVWPSKPIGSGAYVAEEMGLYTTNLSMPFFGEGYINGGYLGVVLFTMLIAYGIAKADKSYWLQTSKELSIGAIRYFLLLGLLMFILRGDLLSSFAYTCGFLSSFYFVKSILK